MKHMFKKTLITGALTGFLFGSAGLQAQETPALPYWQDIQTVAVNKELPRSSFMSYDDRLSAINANYANSPFYSLLNGTWK